MKKMRKKIAILLLALCATATVNAAPKINGATSADDLCGSYIWYNKQAAANPTTNVTGDALKALYDAGTSKSKYVYVTKVDDSTIKIWGMFEKPVTATLIFNASGSLNYIDIAVNQVSGYYYYKNSSTGAVTEGDIKVSQSTWSATANNNAGGYVTYQTIRMYASGDIIYASNNWIRQFISANDGKTYSYERWVIPGYWQDPETQKYTFFNYLTAAPASYDQYNALMYVEFDKTIQNYAYTTYPVNITQDRNAVQVQNFNGGGTTVNIDLRADNSIDIAPNQTGTFGSTEYTYYPSPEGELGYTEGTEITGTGTEDELTWGSYSRRIASSKAGYQYSSGKIVFMNKDVNKFHFPVALTMTDAGWASFSSEKALDFTGTGLTPYAVSAVDATNGATLSPVEGAVAPHTGLFVSGVADNYEIPTVAEGNSLPANALVATSQGEHTSDGQTYWGLGLDANSGQVGLKKMSAGSVAANKAYLIFDRAAAGAKSFLPFNFGGTTAIEGSLTPNPSPEGKGSLYNLQGQRVGEGYRGIVIKNGKKVVKH